MRLKRLLDWWVLPKAKPKCPNLYDIWRTNEEMKASFEPFAAELERIIDTARPILEAQGICIKRDYTDGYVRDMGGFDYFQWRYSFEKRYFDGLITSSCSVDLEYLEPQVKNSEGKTYHGEYASHIHTLVHHKGATAIVDVHLNERIEIGFQELDRLVNIVLSRLAASEALVPERYRTTLLPPNQWQSS